MLAYLSLIAATPAPATLGERASYLTCSWPSCRVAVHYGSRAGRSPVKLAFMHNDEERDHADDYGAHATCQDNQKKIVHLRGDAEDSDSFPASAKRPCTAA